MTQVHFTLKQEEIQKLIEGSVKDDLSKNILTTVFNQLMEEQRNQYIGVGAYERDENRVSSRNGYYDREYTTRIGSLTLRVPRTRDGLFSTDIFDRYQRHEKALLAAMLEMYISGVSTRKVSQVVEELCGKNISKSFVSNLTKELDDIVENWRNAPFEKSYPYLMTDVLYIKVRENSRVVSKSCHIAIGFNEEGEREVLGFLIQDGESEATWTHFFEYLKRRELKGIQLVISDAHKGLVQAIRKCFTGVSWQRCQVHFLRNIFATVPKKNSSLFREQVKALFRITNLEQARALKNEILEQFSEEKGYQIACTCLDEGFEDAFQYVIVGQAHTRIRSTNLLERLNQEVRRREKVVRIFPNTASATRLIGAMLMHQHEDWIGATRTYIKL